MGGEDFIHRMQHLKGAGGDHREVRQFLAEPAKTGQEFAGSLNLVQEQQAPKVGGTYNPRIHSSRSGIPPESAASSTSNSFSRSLGIRPASGR